MGKIRLGSDDIKYITLFETLTGARVKDCIQVENSMGFLVDKGDMGLAIGKNGTSIEKVRAALGKGVFVAEFADDANDFVKNMFSPVKIKQVRIRETGDEKVADIDVARNDRKRVIGQEGIRIKIAKELSKRHYNIDNINIKVV
jgi:transcription termination/antitermination protein NusA